MVEDPLAEALLMGRFQAGHDGPSSTSSEDAGLTIEPVDGEDPRRGKRLSPWPGSDDRATCVARAARRACAGKASAVRAARWNTLVETPVERGRAQRTGGAPRTGRAAPPRHAPRALDESDGRPAARSASARSTASWAAAWSPGSLVLLGGEPGIGKSTLVLAMLRRARARQAGRPTCSTPRARSPQRSCSFARRAWALPAALPASTSTSWPRPIVERIVAAAEAAAARRCSSSTRSRR